MTIIDYWNGDDDSGKEDNSNDGYTGEVNDIDGENFDYNFYYDYKPKFMSNAECKI